MKSLRAVFLLPAILLAGCANKRDVPKVMPETIDREFAAAVSEWDLNGDGQATCDDLSIYWTDIFNRLDSDKDELLTGSEFSNAVWIEETFRLVHFDIVDSDHNRVITVNEFTALNHSRFGRFDRDGDCLVEREDIRAMLEAQRRRGRNGEGAKERTGGGRDGGGRGKGRRQTVPENIQG